MNINDNIYKRNNQYKILEKINQKDTLVDKNSKGKEKPWKNKKLKSLKLSDTYKRLRQENKFLRIHQCANFLEFKRFEDGSLKLKNMYTCQLRLCSMCAWRRELKIFSQVSKVINSINSKCDYGYLFLTLTCKNVTGEELKNQLDILFKSFDKMFRRKDIKQSIKGWFRALEVTHDIDRVITHDMYHGNKEKHLKSRKSYYNNLGLKIGDNNPNFDMYHPHFHIILMVNKSYFTDKNYYISQAKWTSLWKESLKCDYIPIVHVQRFKKSNGKEVAEVSKYTVKDGDFLVNDDPELTNKTVVILDTVLAYRRLVAFGGLMKEEHRRLNLSDVNKDTDLIHIDEDGEVTSKEINYVIEHFCWNVGYSNYTKI